MIPFPQRATGCDDLVQFPGSQVITLHLHGASGWYPNPSKRVGGRSVLLSPLFLNGLGVFEKDESLLQITGWQQEQTIIHPSFAKNVDAPPYDELWKRAAIAIDEAITITIIGYSLPEADKAAVCLLSKHCAPEKLRVVNQDPKATARLYRILAPERAHAKDAATCFEEWLRNTPDCITEGIPSPKP
jgi:hypothetical protein